MRSRQEEDIPTGGLLVSDFRSIYRAWSKQVVRWIREEGGHGPDEEDLVQEVFLVVYRRLSEIDEQTFAAWLHQVARYQMNNFRRLRWSSLMRRREPLSEETPSSLADPETMLHRKERRRILERLLSTLPDAQRAAVIMYEIQGHSCDEIAQFQRIPRNTVWTRLHVGRNRLRAGAERIEGSGQSSISH